jgi:hypothetical protein
MTKKNRKAKAQPVMDEPVSIEQMTPEQVVIGTEPTPAEPAVQAQEKANDQPVTPRKKVKRYASVDAIKDTDVISWFKPQAKGPVGKSKSSNRYNRYYKIGITVAEFCQAYKDNNEPRMLARNDLRWDLQHGLITLEAPQAPEKSEAAE